MFNLLDVPAIEGIVAVSEAWGWTLSSSGAGSGKDELSFAAALPFPFRPVAGFVLVFSRVAGAAEEALEPDGALLGFVAFLGGGGRGAGSSSSSSSGEWDRDDPNASIDLGRK